MSTLSSSQGLISHIVWCSGAQKEALNGSVGVLGGLWEQEDEIFILS